MLKQRLYDRERLLGIFKCRTDKGRLPMIAGRIGTGDLQIQAVSEYIVRHDFLPKGYDRIPVAKIMEMSRLLLEDGVELRTKKTVMMILAHSSCNEALLALAIYNQSPEPELSVFAELALGECKMWNEG